MGLGHWWCDFGTGAGLPVNVGVAGARQAVQPHIFQSGGGRTVGTSGEGGCGGVCPPAARLHRFICEVCSRSALLNMRVSQVSGFCFYSEGGRLWLRLSPRLLCESPLYLPSPVPGFVELSVSAGWGQGSHWPVCSSLCWIAASCRLFIGSRPV